jgi:hypothetical protein
MNPGSLSCLTCHAEIPAAEPQCPACGRERRREAQRAARTRQFQDPHARIWKRFAPLLPWVVVAVFFLACVRGMFWAARVAGGSNPTVEWYKPWPNRLVGPKNHLK